MPRRIPVRDVVVLLPGILGSVLQRDGQDVWAFSKGALWRGLVSLGGSVKDLRLEHDDPERPELGDGVTAARLMPDIHLIPGFWKIDGYGKVKRVLQARFDLVEGKNWFDFPYDWRRDNRAAAHRLAEHAPAWLDRWRRESGNPDAKLVLVGHSMGGLVARYYLEVLDGWKDTRTLLTFGTPYRGSLNALDFLCNGFVKGFGPFKLDLSDLLRSLTSVHQLLPTYACVDDGSGALRKILEASGLASDGVDQARVQQAIDFHDSIADAVERNGGYGRYDIHPVVGIFQPTRLSASARDGTVRTLTTYDGDDDGGDGTVPRVSATPLELSEDPRETYATESHSSLQNVDALLVQLMGVLTREPMGAFRASPFDGFRLEVDDVVAPDQPLDVDVATGGPAPGAVVTVTDADTDEVWQESTELDGDGRGRVTFAPLRQGVYRVTVADVENMARPVTDIVVVGDDTSAARAVEELPPST